MAGRKPTPPRPVAQVQTPGVDDKQTQRALDTLAAAVQRLESIAAGSGGDSAPSGTGFVRVTAGVYDTPLTDTELTTHVDVFTSGLKGATPASGGGTINFLRADGTWTTPSGATLADGDYGDITVSGGGATLNIDAGVITATELASDAVTTVKILNANVTDAKLASDSVTTVKILNANVTDAKLASDSVTTVKILNGNVTDAKLASDSVTTVKILDANVTLAKLANIAAARIIGSVAGGVPAELTPTQTTALLNEVTSVLKGLAPASGGGTANFLRADATWAPPPGTGPSLGLAVALAMFTARR